VENRERDIFGTQNQFAPLKDGQTRQSHLFPLRASLPPFLLFCLFRASQRTSLAKQLSLSLSFAPIRQNSDRHGRGFRIISTGTGTGTSRSYVFVIFS
jgi:hypothetical protein